jgi:hypothetical protein
VQNNRCGVCKNCKQVEKTKGHMLAISAQHQQNIHDGRGHDDGTVAVWNDTLRDFPCTGSFTYEPGRNIHKNGEPFISVNRTGETTPEHADAMTRHLVDLLNAHPATMEAIFEKHREALRDA